MVIAMVSDKCDHRGELWCTRSDECGGGGGGDVERWVSCTLVGWFVCVFNLSFISLSCSSLTQAGNNTPCKVY